MYEIKKVNKIFIETKHRTHLYKNIQNLIVCKNNDIKNIVFITKDNYDTVERYRVAHFLQVLEEIEDWNGIVCLFSNTVLLESYLEYIDILVFSRVFYNKKFEKVLAKCKKLSIPIIFEIDDLIFDKKYLEIIMQSTGDYNRQLLLNMANSYFEMAKRCDGYWTTNDFLANKIRETFGGKTWILHNFLNKEETEVAQIYCNQKEENSYRDKFIIGYFSGSSTHYQDFMEIAEEISEFMLNHENVYLKIVGYMNIPPILEMLEREGRIIKLPFMDGCSLKKEIAEIDVNLIPLVVNEFTNCKSEIKYFDAAAVGTISCMTPTYVYKQMEENNILGFYCKKGEWMDKLEYLYSHRKELVKYIDILSEQSGEIYSYYNQADKIHKILEETKAYKK